MIGLETKPKTFIDESHELVAAVPGAVNLADPKNNILIDKLLPVYHKRDEMSMENVTYPASKNKTPFLTAMIDLFKNYLKIDAQMSEIFVGNGVDYIIEYLSFVFAEKGTVVLLPKYRSNRYNPLFHLCGATIEYIDLDNLSNAPPTNATLLILEHPNLQDDFGVDIAKVIKWGQQNVNLHVILNEEEFLSSIKETPSTNIYDVNELDKSRIHIVYSSMCDWGMPALNLALLFSKNPEVIRMINLSCGDYRCSSNEEWIFRRIINDHQLRDDLINTLHLRLKENASLASQILDSQQIKHSVKRNSIFIDLSSYIKNDNEEMKVWKTLLEKFKVNVAPGHSALSMDVYGFFSISLLQKTDDLKQGLQNLVEGISYVESSSSSPEQ